MKNGVLEFLPVQKSSQFIENDSNLVVDRYDSNKLRIHNFFHDIFRNLFSTIYGYGCTEVTVAELCHGIHSLSERLALQFWGQQQSIMLQNHGPVAKMTQGYSASIVLQGMEGDEQCIELRRWNLHFSFLECPSLMTLKNLVA